MPGRDENDSSVLYLPTHKPEYLGSVRWTCNFESLFPQISVSKIYIYLPLFSFSWNIYNSDLYCFAGNDVQYYDEMESCCKSLIIYVKKWEITKYGGSLVLELVFLSSGSFSGNSTARLSARAVVVRGDLWDICRHRQDGRRSGGILCTLCGLPAPRQQGTWTWKTSALWTLCRSMKLLTSIKFMQ